MSTRAPTHVVGVRIEDGLLTRIDEAVRTNRAYKDRSAFLGAALREKLVKDFKDSELQAVAIRKIHGDMRSLDDKLCTFIELFGEFVFAFFMSCPPLPLDDKRAMASIAIPAKKQYALFLQNFIETTKRSGTGILSRLAEDLRQDPEKPHA